jgi:hypothetical protein
VIVLRGEDVVQLGDGREGNEGEQEGEGSFHGLGVCGDAATLVHLRECFKGRTSPMLCVLLGERNECAVGIPANERAARRSIVSPRNLLLRFVS